jgi:hypothetical protein
MVSSRAPRIHRNEYCLLVWILPVAMHEPGPRERPLWGEESWGANVADGSNSEVQNLTHPVPSSHDLYNGILLN